MSDPHPRLVPARMLNEFAYCPRLFHLEWVQGEFADNEETVHGRSVHRRVDEPSRPLPEPAAMEGSVAAHSVELDAPLLGMVAKMDLVEGTDGVVAPVERKRGRPRPDGMVWEPEELQVVAQALILRENGYRVDEGVVSFPESRTRISIRITPERERRVQALLGELRTVARGPCPPPLVDSPKCPRCSLVGICLPDETRALTSAGTAPVRRLLAPRDDAQPLFVQEQGARVGRRGGRIEVTKGGQRLASVRAIDVSSVALYGNVTVSARALRGLVEDGAPVTHHTYGGWLVGVTTGPGHRNAALRVRQFAAAAEPDRALAIARRMVAGKIRNQRTLLRRNARVPVDSERSDLARIERRALCADDAAALLGHEGAAARIYFGRFASLLAPPGPLATSFVFAGRNRRPARDPVNALLSFAYGLLVREAVDACLRVGFDPLVGVYHRPRYGRPALALDLAEEFRPLVADSVVVRFVNNGQAGANTFVSRGGAYALTSNGRREFISAFQQRMREEIRHPLFGYRASYRRIIELQARILARVLTEEIAVYRPFTTR